MVESTPLAHNHWRHKARRRDQTASWGYSVKDFDSYLGEHQTAWRVDNIADQRRGLQNGVSRSWILPAEAWTDGLWPGIRSSLPAYTKDRIEVHKGAHNLKSSWILCANLYFPFRSPGGLALLAAFLKSRVSQDIESVERVELEYAEKPPLDPQTLLGEPDGGRRGANQTSPDVAFIVRTKSCEGLVLVENKLTEHSFYRCSGRKKEAANPDPTRCLDWPKIQADSLRQCWQRQWEQSQGKPRRYWEYLRFSEHGMRTLTRCPAATAGYQLFRQQALAEAIATSPKYGLVASCVAYDARNDALLHCLRGTGVDDFTTGWGGLFEGRAAFTTWTHQDWVSWVREHDDAGEWADWLTYVETRYEYRA